MNQEMIELTKMYNPKYPLSTPLTLTTDNGIAYRIKPRKNISMLSIDSPPRNPYGKKRILPPLYPSIPIETQADQAVNLILNEYGIEPYKICVSVTTFNKIDEVKTVIDTNIVSANELQQIIYNSKPIGGNLYHTHLVKILLDIEYYSKRK